VNVTTDNIEAYHSIIPKQFNRQKTAQKQQKTKNERKNDSKNIPPIQIADQQTNCRQL
jgi:hypothetical protein